LVAWRVHALSDWPTVGLAIAGTLGGVFLTQRRQDLRDRRADQAHLRDVRIRRLHAAYAEAVRAGKDAIVLADELLVARAHASPSPSGKDGGEAIERLLHGETLLMLETDATEPLELVDKIWLDFARYRNHLRDGEVGEREAARDAMMGGLEALGRYAREHLARLEAPSDRKAWKGARP
jgi:hypothetical protein